MQLVITADEVKAVDDWRYANRVPTRSAAVRQLIALGISARPAKSEAET